MTRRLALLLSYDGGRYAGFQRQQRHGQLAHLTVQHCLEAAVGHVLGQPDTVHPSGRTDAGVHALGQVVHLHTSSDISLERLPYALNHNLPPDIVVRACTEVPDTFHARKSAQRKTYRFTIYRDRFPSPFWRDYTYHWYGPLNISQMQAAASLLTGRHDFQAFRTTGSSATTTVRTIFQLAVAESGPFITITAEADGFLYNMVRILAGTLLEVGQGRKSLDDVTTALTSGDRSRSGRTLPPQGLCLVNVTYPTPLWEAELVDNAAFPHLK